MVPWSWFLGLGNVLAMPQSGGGVVLPWSFGDASPGVGFRGFGSDKTLWGWGRLWQCSSAAVALGSSGDVPGLVWHSGLRVELFGDATALPRRFG